MGGSWVICWFSRLTSLLSRSGSFTDYNSGNLGYGGRNSGLGVRECASRKLASMAGNLSTTGFPEVEF